MTTWRLCGVASCAALLLATQPSSSFAQTAPPDNGPPVQSLPVPGGKPGKPEKAAKPAKPEEPEVKNRVFLTLFGGPQSYSMTDVNHGIEETNAHLSGTGFETKKISGGTGFGAGLRFARTSRLSLQLDFNRLTARASHDALIQGGTVPVNEDVSMPASGFLLTAAVHRKWHGLHYGLGAGPGYYFTKGKLFSRVGDQRLTYDVHGKGFGFHVLGLLDTGLSRHLRLEGALGYRVAKSGNLKFGDNDVVLTDGSTFKADWSGMTSRVGFSVPFDPGHYPEGQNLK